MSKRGHSGVKNPNWAFSLVFYDRFHYFWIKQMMLLVPGKRLSFNILPNKKIQLRDKAKIAVVAKEGKLKSPHWDPPGIHAPPDSGPSPERARLALASVWRQS